ncbi:hypothetical protein NK8_82590 (plasmid) [Caballeronia sp. NK8]|nr:hypothetical protein NK8_67400 [Caballeronia sp. NK8]BCQ30068.1 hypothetical protein NK8_82590 [Caballeronia sp. NK8]
MSYGQLDSILRSTTDAIITIDATQRIVKVNPTAERVFGCAARDAIGGPLSRFIPVRYRAAHDDQVRHFEQTRVSERRMGPQRVLYGLRADGEEFPIEASISQADASVLGKGRAIDLSQPRRLLRPTVLVHLVTSVRAHPRLESALQLATLRRVCHRAFCCLRTQPACPQRLRLTRHNGHLSF